MCTGLFLAIGGCWTSVTPTARTNVESSDAGTSKADPGIRFSDIASSSGVDWIGRNGEESHKFAMLEAFGCGCAIDDFDRDDQLDLFFAGGGRFGPQNEILPQPIGLFRQTTTGKFIAVTTNAGLEPVLHYNHGTFTADFDEDGFSDLLITGWGGLQLFQNQGDGTFADITEASGLNDPLWSTAAGWADLNRDNVMDLYVGHYVDWSFQNNPVCVNSRLGERNVCAPSDFQGLPCTVFLGNGDGTFRVGGSEIGVQEIGKVLGVVIADLNEDHQPDIYVANDTLPNHLYVSQPSGTYRECAYEYGVALGEMGMADGSMGVDVGDLDGDGRIDIWVANYEEQSFAFYRNLGNELFTHASRPFGITAVGTLSVGFGTVIFDADGDGFQDIFCANGHIWAPNNIVDRQQRPYLFWNDQGKKFRNIGSHSGPYFQSRHLGRGAATGDLDANGTPDLVVTHTNFPVAVLTNETRISNWITVRLVGRTSVRSAVGAKVTIRTNQKSQIGLVKGGGSYLSTSDRSITFGLGTETAVKDLEIEWPSGSKSRFTDISAGQALNVIEHNN